MKIGDVVVLRFQLVRRGPDHLFQHVNLVLLLLDVELQVFQRGSRELPDLDLSLQELLFTISCRLVSSSQGALHLIKLGHLGLELVLHLVSTLRCHGEVLRLLINQ